MDAQFAQSDSVEFEKRRALRSAQLEEFFRRDRVSAGFAIPTLLLIGAVHWGNVPQGALLIWLAVMIPLQATRFAAARIFLAMQPASRSSTLWRDFVTVAALTSGCGWGAILFLLDTGRPDFLFLFRVAALAAALGVTMNAMSVILRVYVAFIGSVATVVIAYLLTHASYLPGLERASLTAGAVIYCGVLLLIGRSVGALTHAALLQGFEREEALARVTESHRLELELREKLEAESRQLEATNRKLHEANLKLHDLARQDGLTGVFNRRHLMEELGRCVHAFQRHGQIVSVVLIDVDHFKQINDTYGHQCGDQTLVALCARAGELLRELDLFGRWGGEEFLCVLPQTAYADALICAERIRAALAASPLIAGMPELRVTASFGVATCIAGDDADSLVKRADDALYAAKAGGRNRVAGGAPAG